MPDQIRDHSITGIDDERLVDVIRSARNRLVVMAPGVHDTVAVAICERWRELGREAVTVILDVDPEVCRMGYGTLSALQKLKERASELRTLVSHQPGARIGLVVTEAAVVVWAPTPLLVEAGPRAERTTNAIRLDFVPDGIRTEVGLGAKGVGGQTIGLDPVRDADVDAVAKDIEQNPPMQFDVARKVRVFNARFEFVDLKVNGCLISRKKVALPAWLQPYIGGAKVEGLLKSQFTLLSEGVVAGEETVSKYRLRIMKQHLVALPPYGQVILREGKPKFLECYGRLQRLIACFQKRIQNQLDQEIAKNCSALVEILLPAVRARQPVEWRKRGVISDDGIRLMLTDALSKAFGTAEGIVTKMSATLTFKGVTYESLKDPEFIELVRKRFPPLAAPHEEYDAARAIPLPRPVAAGG